APGGQPEQAGTAQGGPFLVGRSRSLESRRLPARLERLIAGVAAMAGRLGHAEHDVAEHGLIADLELDVVVLDPAAGHDLAELSRSGPLADRRLVGGDHRQPYEELRHFPDGLPTLATRVRVPVTGLREVDDGE